jgi:hypothetical protein
VSSEPVQAKVLERVIGKSVFQYLITGKGVHHCLRIRD